MRVLAADVGGTKTRLALYVRQPDGSFESVRSERYASREHGDFGTIIRRFLAGDPAPVDRAGIGVAGPVRDRVCRATNLPWTLDAGGLERDLGITHVALVNDFHAIALGIGDLGDGDLAVLQDRPRDPTGPMAIVGAGTGLGEAVVIKEAERLRVLASEGGHTDFPPRNEVEMDLLRFLLRRHNRVSVERVVSGPGLYALYEFLVETGRERTGDEVRARIATGDPGQVIGEAALAGTDPACVRAVELFVSAYGAEVGNLALTVLPTGGVFVAGGIAPKLIDRFRAGPFLEAFRAKGRMSPLLETMPVAVITNTGVGLLGARAAALLEGS